MRLILCNECAAKYIDENGEPSQFFLAMFGPQGSEKMDECVLISSPAHELPTWWRAGELTTLPCDGCAVVLSISCSSEWFLQQRLLSPPLKLN